MSIRSATPFWWSGVLLRKNSVAGRCLPCIMSDGCVSCFESFVWAPRCSHRTKSCVCVLSVFVWVGAPLLCSPQTNDTVCKIAQKTDTCMQVVSNVALRATFLDAPPHKGFLLCQPNGTGALARV